MSKSIICALVVCAGLYSQLSAASILFDESIVPSNPVNGFGSFAFDDFTGAVSTTPTSLVFDVIDSNSSNGVFGGFGVDYVLDDGNGNFLPQDFDAAQASLDVRLKVLPLNEATSVRFSVLDQDSATNADDHVYEFDISSIPADGSFYDLSLPLQSPLFTQGAFGFAPGDGVVNPGLRQIQIQSVFDSTGRLNIELDFAQIQIPEVPEPTSSLILLTGLASLGFRRYL